MGKLEQEARLERRRANIQKIILESIKTAGLLSLVLLAPNALRMLKLNDNGRIRSKNPKYTVESSFHKLLSKGFIKIEVINDIKKVRLTEKGDKTLERMRALSVNKTEFPRWDKRWRVIIYDIREKRRGVRIGIQRTLHSCGFYKLQNSIWVYPYECEDLITLLKADFKIGSEVLYMIVEKIENDKKLRDYFKLS